MFTGFSKNFEGYVYMVAVKPLTLIAQVTETH